MSLNDPHLYTFPYSSITPLGWLNDQLRIQADGLSGHLDEFWPDVKDSKWIGGTTDGWERMPYWLDGVIPLAWLIDDTQLQKRVTSYIDYILTHQHEDGRLGPLPEDEKLAGDVWSQALALKMLIAYYEATHDERAPIAVEKNLRMLADYCGPHPLFDWGKFRRSDFLLSIWWLYDRTHADWLCDLAVKIWCQGFDWQSFYTRWPCTQPTQKDKWTYEGHVVNNAMAIKETALWWRLSGDENDLTFADYMIDALDRYHGMPTGVFSGDECVAGKSPVQGTELCAVVEYMFSLETIIRLSGNPKYADRLERITYNALPATCTPDMWAHQYDQQINQIECSSREDRCWSSNGPDSNLYGLEPNFGCCTANMHQGWPKFVAHMWMHNNEDKIACIAYAPSQLNTQIDAVPVTLRQETNYPFTQDIHFTVTVDAPVQFALMLRIPAWVRAAYCETNGKRTVIHQRGEFYTIEKAWEGTTNLTLSFEVDTDIVPRSNNAVALSRGPLLYALKIEEKWQQVNTDNPLRTLPHADWEVYPETPWNYALVMNEDGTQCDVKYTQHSLQKPVFSPDNAPVTAVVRAKKVPEWKEKNGSADTVPVSPVHTEEQEEDVTLIPYGCTNLRIAEFPYTDKSHNSIK